MATRQLWTPEELEALRNTVETVDESRSARDPMVGRRIMAEFFKRAVGSERTSDGLAWQTQMIEKRALGAGDAALARKAVYVRKAMVALKRKASERAQGGNVHDASAKFPSMPAAPDTSATPVQASLPLESLRDRMIRLYARGVITEEELTKHIAS